MKVSLNWLAQYLDVEPIRKDLKGVLDKLTMRGLEVESIHDLSKGFDKVVVAQIEARDRHPNADRLSVCRVNNGKEVLQIVCGAQNMKAGDKIALSMIGAHLPNGLKIEKGKIRDVESFGMLCSETELGIADTSEGILILPQDAPLGEPLAKYLGRNDIVFSLNVTPNRGDALSHLGVARELGAILGQKVKLPTAKLNETSEDASKKISVSIAEAIRPDGTELCLQYHARCIEGVRVGPSPEWLVKYLQSLGMRSINNIVDVTNFVLMEFGQPLHAFDFDRIEGAKIRVRRAVKGEKLPLLDKTEVELSDDDLVIADANRPVALAGVMGGGNSEVTDATKRILLEAAQFLPGAVRRTARRHQKHTDSSHRFERQVDAKGVVAAMERATALIVEVAGGKVAKGAVSAYSTAGKQLATGPLTELDLSVSALAHFLGIDIDAKQAQSCFEQIGFASKAQAEKLRVEIPSFRPDVRIAEDLYEEVLRVWGYERVTPKVPQLNFIPEPTNPIDIRARYIEKLKLTFAEQGFCESVNFGFTSVASNTRWGGKEAANAIALLNPLNEEFNTMKTSLVGGLVENMLLATRHQQRDIRLFEVRPIYVHDPKSETTAREEWRISGIVTGRAFSAALSAQDRDLDFFDAKGFVETSLDAISARGVRYMPGDKLVSDTRLHPAQSAEIAIGRGPCGFIARLHPKVEAEFKLRQPVYVFEFSLDRALEIAKADRKFSGLARFPKSERDLSLLVPVGMPSEKVTQAVLKLGKPLIESAVIVDSYSGEKIPVGTVSLSVSFVLGDPNRTLEEAEVEATVAKILSGLEKELQVRLRTQ